MKISADFYGENCWGIKLLQYKKNKSLDEKKQM